jgi:hypothetical protein
MALTTPRKTDRDPAADYIGRRVTTIGAGKAWNRQVPNIVAAGLVSSLAPSRCTVGSAERAKLLKSSALGYHGRKGAW